MSDGKVIGFKAREALLGLTCMGINITKTEHIDSPHSPGREVYD